MAHIITFNSTPTPRNESSDISEIGNDPLHEEKRRLHLGRENTDGKIIEEPS
jgi:hypothetical protein